MEVILYVRDMKAQVSFYRDVLGIPVKEPTGDEDLSELKWVELDTGSCTLALHGGGEGRLGKDAPKVVFRVYDVAASRASLLQDGVKMGDVRSPGPGIQVCDGWDPEGNRFSIESREQV
jgi:catechol 2,3-dioxygenase-like lactoylglutathione lyase family enzyme